MTPHRLPAHGRAHDEFLRSAMNDRGVHTLDEFHDWLDRRRRATAFSVEKKPLAALRGWTIDPGTGNLVHASGRFFQVSGIEVETNFGSVPRWRQPIINQPEVGILGFLTKRIGGVLHFLIQAKMEPGNVNLLQISPTLQATRSNFTQVHGGKKPPYLDYFLNCDDSRVLVDQLQSEQGARFLRKRNRNVIILVPDNEDVPVHDDFFWLTLAQINELLKIENMVNMDTRTVLSGIRYHAGEDGAQPRTVSGGDCFHDNVLQSALAGDDDSLHDIDTIIRWFVRMKLRYNLEVKPLPLRDVAPDWVNDGETIHHRAHRYFSVVGVSVSATTREITSWDQPLIESAKGGVICFVCQKINGILHFLVQARVEPGNFDGIEMAPTLQFTPSNYDPSRPDDLPPFCDLFASRRADQVRYDAIHSEEGGRFFHDQNRYVVLNTDERQVDRLPDNFFWVTLRQAKEIVRFNNHFNIEARSLFACLGLAR